MMKSIASAAGLIAAVTAFTQPVQPPTYGALLTPNVNAPLITGQSFDITWTPKGSADATVSLVLCNGPSTNCVLQSAAIVEKIPASAAKYTWSVPCSLPAGVQNTATGYGMLIIVDGTGEFQYSTQFSVQVGASCSSSSTTSATTSLRPASSSSSVVSSNPGWNGWTTSTMTTTKATSTPIAISSTSTTASTTSTTSTSTSTSTTSTSRVSSPTTSATRAAVTTSVTSTQSSPAAVTTAPTATSSSATGPQTFTGAAAVPTAFVNVMGVVGAAVLAGLAL